MARYIPYKINGNQTDPSSNEYVVVFYTFGLEVQISLNDNFGVCGGLISEAQKCLLAAIYRRELIRPDVRVSSVSGI